MQHLYNNKVHLDTQERVKQIKQSFRLMMDGAVALSMRQKGADYKLNWGATLPRLKEMAAQIGSDYDLAIELWKQDVRECKILATMLMPAGRILPEVVDIWMEQTESLEIAEQASFNLYQHLPYAADKAFQWIAGQRPLEQVCGFHVLARLFMRGQEPNERGIHEFIDQALTALRDDSLSVRHAALNCMRRFAMLSEDHEKIANSALKTLNLELF